MLNGLPNGSALTRGAVQDPIELSKAFGGADGCSAC